VSLGPRNGRPLVVGHRGAAAVAPENTLAALEAAVAADADLVEFDVGPDLRLAHSPREVPHAQISLDDALEFLRAHRIGVHLDVKLPGYEAAIVDAIRRHDLNGRAIVSTAWPATAREVARLAPELTRAIGYPRDRYGVSRLRFPRGLTAAGAAALRQAMPIRVPVLLTWARANALALHYTLCSRAAVVAAHRLGAPVLAWTANDPDVVRRLASLGVDAIVSDDPGMARRALDGPTAAV
jgi:glycerophosphoryl diester phosphodiesterase